MNTVFSGSLPGIIIALAAMLGALFSMLQTRAVARAAKGASLGPFNGYTQLLRDALARMERLRHENAALAEQLADCQARHRQRGAAAQSHSRSRRSSNPPDERGD